jgi:RNA polymerase sigma factor (sigma-70 family)
VSSASYKGLDDRELIAFCLEGDTHAWEALILRYRRLIYSIPVKFNLSSADAADVFQAVCLKLLEHLRQLKDETKVSAWLITTTTRQCIQVRSQRQREGNNEDEYREPQDPAFSVEEIQIQAQQQQQLRDSLEVLPERCQKLIHMLYFDLRSPSYEQIAQTLDMPVPSIGPTRARCLEKLRSILRKRGIRPRAV